MFDRSQSERDLADELQFHLEAEEQKNIAAGMPEEDARRQARVAFGAMESVKEECRELRVGSWLESIVRDLHYGLRLLRKSPGFALVAIAILALGIGANTAIFSAVNAVLLARWPFSHPDKIVFITEDPSPQFKWTLVSPANFEDYRREQKTFAQLSLWITQSVNLTGQDRPDRLVGSFVSANYFDMFGTVPLMGRLFLAGEDEPGAGYVAVLSYQTWQERFGADPSILGRRITLNNESYNVIGVLPRGYRLPTLNSDVYITTQHHTSYKRDRASKSLLMMGRVKDGVSFSQAEADLNTIAQRLAHDYPNENRGIGIRITDFREVLTSVMRTPLLVLLGAVALILLIACANLANLLLARGVQRQREMVVRIALGARRGRIICQLVAETMLLAIVGGTLGVLLAVAAGPMLVRMAPTSFEKVDVAVDWRVLLFSLSLTLLTGVLFGVAPALPLSRTGVAALNSGSKGVARGSSGGRIRSVFVVLQVAVSVVLLVAAALLIGSFQSLLKSATGMSTSNLLTMEYRLPRNKYTTPASQIAFHHDLALRVAQVPGVLSSAIVQALPFSGNWGWVKYVVDGSAAPEKGKEPRAIENLITPEYFSTVGISLLRGRPFNDQDTTESPSVAIVSRSLADREFKDQDVVGRTLQLVDVDPKVNGQRVRIVGMVGDAKQQSLRDTDTAEIYFPYTQSPAIFGTLVVRTAVDPMGLAEPVRKAVWSLDKDQPVWKVRTLEFLIDRDLEQDRLLMTLMSGFGILAVILTALGTYGVLSNLVSQRRREIGIRMALGAGVGAVRNMVMRQGVKLVATGAAIGVIGAFAASRMIASVLYGVSALNIVAYVAGCGGILAVVLLASYLPARRATRVDPAAVLRYE
jgi:putative ABC transport system permease protein